MSLTQSVRDQVRGSVIPRTVIGPLVDTSTVAVVSSVPARNPAARATISGLTLDATAAHLARAALESVAYQTLDLLDAMRADMNGIGTGVTGAAAIASAAPFRLGSTSLRGDINGGGEVLRLRSSGGGVRITGIPRSASR